MLLHLLLLALAQAPGGEKPKLCAISGTIVNAATGEPVRKAEVTLRQADPPRTPGAYPSSYSTTADAAGKFAMRDVEAGKYRMTVVRTGFVVAEYGSRGPGRPGTTLSLDAGQELKDVSVRMTPQAVISGRVVDEDGDPVAYAQIQVMRYRYSGSERQLTPMGGASTNDLGEYRAFNLAPGRYFVSAVYQNRNSFGPASVDRSAAPGPEEGYVATWYPGTTDRAGASTVEVLAGAQVRGIDFTLSKVRTVRVRGKVNRAAGISGSVTVMLAPRNFQGGFFGAGNRTQVDAQGNFFLRGVATGAYNLYANIFDQDRPYSVRQALDVGSNDVENVTLTIQPGMDVTGQVKVEGTETPSLSGTRLFLRPRESGVMMFSANDGRIGENGSFTLKNVNPDQYDLTVIGLPDGYYVKAVRLGDEEALDAGLNLTRGPAPITVVLSPGAGEVSGVVQNDKPQPVPGATVVLVPSAAAARKRMQAYKTTTTDQYGRYTLKNIDPGDYKLFAWEDVEQGAWQDPEFLKPVESRGHDLTIRENSRESVQLDMIPAETAQAPAKKQ